MFYEASLFLSKFIFMQISFKINLVLQPHALAVINFLIACLFQPCGKHGITLDLLHLVGEASGLKTNIQKSNVLPIQCRDEDKETIQEHLPCQLLEFPCKYLGVPLSLHKLTRAQIQPIIDRIAD